MKKAVRSKSERKNHPPDFSRRPRGLCLEQTVEVRGFSKLKFRAIALEDEGKMVDFHRLLSPKSVCLRYFGYLGLDRRTSHERLVRVCTNTADVYSIVMEQPPHPRSSVKILALGSLSNTPEPYVATFDLLVGREADFPKLAKILLNRLIGLARAFRFEILAGKLLHIDQDAIELCRRLGFAVQDLPEDGTVQVLLKL